MQPLEWFTATNAMIGIAYTYGLHPNASAGRPYDGMWKREYAGGGSFVVAYAEVPETRQIYIGILWQLHRLHHPTIPVLAVPRGYTPMPGRGELFTRQPKEVVEHLHRQTALLELTEEMVKGTICLELLDDPDNPAAGCFFTEVAIGRLTRYLQRRGYPILCTH